MNVGTEALWFPRCMAAVAFLLAGIMLADFLLVPTQSSRHVVPGLVLEGETAKLANALHFVALFWLARAFLLRKKVAVPATLVYCGFVIVALWLWTASYGGEAGYSLRTALITNALITVILLTVCRAVLVRARTFDQP
jgi:hypothetical protein